MELLGINECEKNEKDLMLTAGETVGLDLKNPIDCSQMMVMQASTETKSEEGYGKMYCLRKSVLHAYVYNDKGEREELTITFKLKSQRAPKLTKQ